MNQNRTGPEAIVGAVVTYVLLRLWWNGYFADWGIELFAPQFQQTYGDSVAFGNSVVGTLLVEAINTMVFVGSLTIFLLTRAYRILVDCFTGIAQASGYLRQVTGTVEVDPRQSHAEQLVQSALAGDYATVVQAAEQLHGESFFPRAEPEADVEPKAPVKRTRRRAT